MEKTKSTTRALNNLLARLQRRINEADLENFNSRLDWVIQDNPDIDTKKIKVYPELYDLLYVLQKGLYLSEFADSAKRLGGALASVSVAYLGIKYHSGTVLATLSILPLTCTIPLLYEGFRSLISGATDYIKFKKSGFDRPLSQRERVLSNYLYMGAR